MHPGLKNQSDTSFPAWMWKPGCSSHMEVIFAQDFPPGSRQEPDCARRPIRYRAIWQQTTSLRLIHHHPPAKTANRPDEPQTCVSSQDIVHVILITKSVWFQMSQRNRNRPSHLHRGGDAFTLKMFSGARVTVWFNKHLRAGVVLGISPLQRSSPIHALSNLLQYYCSR